VLEDNQKGAELIMASISHEVAKADEEAILFRANSVAAKLFSNYAKMAILRYLWHVLVLSVHSLNDNAIESFTLEQDQGAHDTTLTAHTAHTTRHSPRTPHTRGWSELAKVRRRVADARVARRALQDRP
jgi:hypothetical protein